MVKKPLHFARFLPASFAALTIFTLAGCASTPEEPVMDEPMPMDASTPLVEEPAAAPAVELKPDYPEKYVVVKGDTLWDISARFLKNPWQWPQIWQSNPQVKNPHLIYPGDVLSIYFVDGQPVMQVQRDGETISIPMTKSGGDTNGIPREVRGKRYPTVKLSPRVREQGLDEAIPTIPIDAIKPFLTRPSVLAEGELEQAPYVVAHADEHMAGGGGYRIYVRGIDEQDVAADYNLVREGEAYRDPDSGEILGYEAVFLGDARMQRFGDPSTLMIESAKREVLTGDRLLPREDNTFLANYMPRGPEHDVDGRIISVFDGVAQIGQFQVVVLNLGRQEDIEAGHVLAVNQRGLEVDDKIEGGSVKLPDERAGEVMVFRVFERVSYALVMRATRAIHINDIVTNP